MGGKYSRKYTASHCLTLVDKLTASVCSRKKVCLHDSGLAIRAIRTLFNSNCYFRSNPLKKKGKKDLFIGWMTKQEPYGNITLDDFLIAIFQS